MSDKLDIKRVQEEDMFEITGSGTFKISVPKLVRSAKFQELIKNLKPIPTTPSK